MKYLQLEDGLEIFNDFLTLKIAKNPVCFPNTFPRIYDKSSIEKLFKEKEKLIQQLETLKEAAVEIEKGNFSLTPTSQQLIETHAHQMLGNNRISDILAGKNLIQILYGTAISDNVIPIDQTARIKLALTIATQQAIGNMKKQLKATCPFTRKDIFLKEMKSALLFRNIFLIAARNSILNNRDEFKDKKETQAFLDALRLLSKEEITKAEFELAAIYNKKKSILTPQQIKKLNEWEVHMGNPLIQTPEAFEGTQAHLVNEILELTDFIWAAARGKLETIQSLMQREINLNETDKFDKTALMWAAEKGKLEVVQFLAQQVIVDVNAKDNNGNTALMWAAIAGKLESVKYFTELEEIDVNEKNLDGQTALTWAAIKGQLEVVKYLMELKKVDINVKNNDGYTALIWAAIAGQLEVVKYLSESKKLDVNAKDNNDKTALMWAILHGQLEVVKYLAQLEEMDVNAKDNDGQTALMLGAERDHLEAVKYLTQLEKIDVNAKDNNGATALMLAAEAGELETVKYLTQLEKIDVNAKDNDGKTALMLIATKRRQLEIMKYLTQLEKIDVNAKDKYSQTALMLAARTGNLEAVKHLTPLERVDVNVKDNDGKTALMLATEAHELQVAQYLEQLQKTASAMNYLYSMQRAANQGEKINSTIESQGPKETDKPSL